MKTRKRGELESLVVGLDCSTTATKAIVVDRRGRVVAHARETISLSSPHPGYYEQEPDDWWSSSRKVLRTITRLIDPEKIVALAISNQRETIAPFDRNGESLRPAIVWLDERCKAQVKPFAQRIGTNRIHRITGKPADYAPAVYRLAWLKEYEPAMFDRIDMICDVHSYLAWKLTGSPRTSWASADPLGLFDLENKKWSSIILDALGLRLNQMPETCRPGTILGRLGQGASTSTGLSAETLVIAGGGDGQCAGLGSNILASNCAYLNLGTAVVAGVFGTRYRTSRAFRTMVSCSEDGYYYECSLRGGTFAIDWFIGKVLKIDRRNQPDVYKQLENEARKAPAGSGGMLYLPYLCGAMNPYWDVDARGAFVGVSPSHGRGHFFRAILEGIAFEQRLAIEAVEKETGTTVENMTAIGGGAASGLWCSIIADVTGRNLHVPENTEASALGAAIAASVGAGWYGTFKQAAKEMTGSKNTVLHNEENRNTYQQLYSRYKKLYPALKRTV